MKNALLAGVCAAALTLVAPTASLALDMSQGWYISMFGGLSVPETMKGKFIVNPAGLNLAYTSKVKLKDGFILGLAVGKTITENIRSELEFAFANHKAKNHVITGPPGIPLIYAATGGSLKSFTILGNVWYDFNNTSRFTPYIGGGIGIGIVDSNMRHVRTSAAALKDSDVAFAFQLGTGVNVALSPTVSVGLGYRFKGIVDFSLKQNSPAFIFTDNKGLDLYTHNFLANVTFKFGGP